jgi:hypothetical protein
VSASRFVLRNCCLDIRSALNLGPIVASSAIAEHTEFNASQPTAIVAPNTIALGVFSSI